MRRNARNNRTSNRINRLEVIIGLLKSNEVCTIGEISDFVGVSKRTVSRDLALLFERGYPIESEKGKGGGVRLREGGALRNLFLSSKEVIDLLLNISIMEKIGTEIFLEDLKSLKFKLSALIRPSQSNRIMKIRQRIIIGDKRPEQATSTLGYERSILIEQLKKGFISQRQIHIDYVDINNRQTNRVVEPHFLIICWPVWYLVAWDLSVEDVRCFRVDRIFSCKQLEKTFRLKSNQLFELFLSPPFESL